MTLMKDAETPVSAYIEAERRGSDPGCRLVVVDITTAEQAKQELRETEERLTFALAATRTGMWEWEIASGEIYCSPECIDIVGIGSLSPKLDTVKRLLHPEDAPRVEASIRRALAEERTESIECRVVRSGGEVARVFVRGQIRRDDAGKPVSLIGIVQEVTDR